MRKRIGKKPSERRMTKTDTIQGPIRQIVKGEFIGDPIMEPVRVGAPPQPPTRLCRVTLECGHTFAKYSRTLPEGSTRCDSCQDTQFQVIG